MVSHSVVAGIVSKKREKVRTALEKEAFGYDGDKFQQRISRLRTANASGVGRAGAEGGRVRGSSRD